MKNFTKQNFKTNPLWIRLLIMAFMLLAGSSSAWAANVYITTTSTNKINFYTWNNTCNSTGWPGVSLTTSATKNDDANGGGFYKFPTSGNCSDNSYNYIINGSGQTADLSISSTTWGVYNGSNAFTVLMTEANMSSKSITFRSDALSGWSTNTSTTWDATKKKYKTAEVNYSKQSGIDVYIAGTKFIYKAPANFGTPATGNYIIYWDPYTSNITFETPCPSSVTPGTASGAKTICSGGSATVSLSGNTSGSTIQWQKSTTSSTSGFANINGATNSSYTANNLTQTTYFRAVVTLSKSGCDSKTDNSGAVTITVNPIPSAPYNGVAQSTTICAGSSYTFDSNYIWYTSETGTTTVSGSKTINSKTDYYISQKSNNCESARTKYTVNVDAKPEAPKLSTKQHIVKCGDTFLKKGIITITNFNPDYQYRMGGEDNPVLTLTKGELGGIETASSYYVTAINGTCSTTSASAQAVNETIYTSSSVTTGGATQITTTTALLTAKDVVIGGDKDNIEWGFEYKTTSSAVTTIKTQYSSTSTSFSYNVSPLESNTTYSYRAFVNDKTCGNIYYGEWVDFTTLVACTNTTISIAPDPAPSCSVGSLELSAVVKDASTGAVINNPGGTYVWKKADDHGVPREISGATASTYTATESGKYYVNYLRGESLYCSSQSTVYELTIENPTASIEGNECVNGTQEYTVTGSTFASYEWAAEDASTMTITNATSATANVAMKAASGILKVRGTTAAGCQSDWATMTLYAVPTVSPSATVENICEGETKTIKITTNAESIQWYKDGAAIDGATSAALDITKAGTYYAKVSNATTGCSNQSINFEVANAFGSDITPTISGTTSVQSGATGVEYSTAEVSGAKYEWDLPTGWTISSGKETSKITVAVPDTEGNGTVKVTITNTNNGCAKTATLDVAWMDGFTVYLRRPHAKNETTQYNYWFEKSNAAGPGYIKFGTVKASPSTSELYTYNGGTGAETAGDLGTKGTESFTDCDGYVWDAYNIGIDVTALYFHAPNNKSTNGSTYGGHATYTRSYSQATAISEDLYFTMGNWSNGTMGRTLTKVKKPFEGIEIEALGETEICNNNMASFAALYLSSNCTGKSVKSYAWKVSSDEESWSDYTTGKGATSNNIRPNVAGHYRLECELGDGSKVVSNSIEITTKTCTISNADLNNITSNLPIIMVNTGDKAFPSVDNGKHCSASADDLKKKRSVDVKILWNQAENGTVSSTDAYSNGANLYYDRKARMNYRGSSSLNFEKKSFAFCPGDENCGQDDDKSADYVKTKKMNMFDIGEAEDKDWVLYAAYVDPSMMRNILAMETYSAMTGKWGVKNKYVELYIDGQYQGVYVFMDKVTQNKKRVDVKWDVKDDTKREFILKFDKTDAADRYELSSGDQKTFESDITGKTGISTYDTEVDQRFEIEYPEKEDIEDDGGYWSDVYSFVLGKVNEFESALSKGDFTKVRDLINYEFWADFFILNEFAKNVDAYRASCIFVYTGGKFEAWPLWDYELSFNNTVTGSGKGRGDINGLLIEHSDVYSDEFPAPFWWTGKYNDSNMYSGLLKDPCFLQKIKERWALHTKEGGALHPSTTTAKTAAYKAILDAKGAATREFKKWPVTSRGKDACSEKNTGYYNYGGGGATNYDNSYKQLNEWLAGDADTDPRITGLQKEIDKFDDVIKFGISSTIDKEETTPWRAVNVTVDAVGADFTYTITPEITKGQVIEGSGNLLIYAELPQTYTVVTTLDAKDQCGANPEDNASSTVTFTVNDLVDNCEE